MIWTVAKKELRGYFNSAIAVIFLAAFLVVAFYTFFWREQFFARGLADLRPLFEWMPKLLIILVSALAMRLWSDERRAGTLEILLTLPVARWKLVVGKFIAGLLLISLALALTFGLPLTIAKMGDLDVGPVFGGYLAALLLSAAYLSIGMCVSAATDNQIVAFVGTALLCGIAYAIGDSGGAIGRALGTGVRFESVARGVLDLRDLAYYGSIVAIGIAVNVLLLQRLTWGRGASGRGRRLGMMLGVGLVAANAIALVVWLAPVRGARIDLTQDGTYSLSPPTEKIVSNLDERLLIRGYFSERTHPKLAPLIPQIGDLLDEYRVVGGGKVRVEIIDPTDSDPAKREAKERFAIDPTPLRFATQTEKSVVNAYFAIAIEYGDQQAVLGLDQLIQVRVIDIGEVEIKLRNLEYQLTKTIKKTVSKFSSVDTLFASTPGQVRLTAYVTSKSLPENWKEGPAKLQKVVDELTTQAGGKLVFTTVEPKTDAEQRELFEKYGVRPYQDLISGQVYYFHLVLQVGDRVARITPPQNLGEADLRNALNEGLQRAAPGFTRVVGIWSPPAPPPMEFGQGMPPQRMPPPQQFQTLANALSGNYEVRSVDLGSAVPPEIETLVLAGPANLDPAAVRFVDQFVMRGGSLVVLAGRHRIARAAGLALEKVTTGLDPLFQKWGIELGSDLVLDTKNDAFPIPVNRQLGNGMIVREINQLPYPFFVRMDGDQLSSSVITSGLTGSVMHWATQVTAVTKIGNDEHRVESLLSSSSDAWLSSSIEIQPDLDKYPQVGFPATTGTKSKRVLAVAVTGGFTSGVTNPTATDPEERDENDPAAADTTWIEHSPPDTRIVVFGSSAFVSDDVLGLAQQLESDLAAANVQLVHNAVDWSLADTDLLSIRSRTAAPRAITLAPESRGLYRTVNLVLALLGLLAVIGVTWLRRRAVTPIIVGKEA